jgi:hypothetical protein
MFCGILFYFLKLEIGSGANGTPPGGKGGGTGQSRLRVFKWDPKSRLGGICWAGLLQKTGTHFLGARDQL